MQGTNWQPGWTGDRNWILVWAHEIEKARCCSLEPRRKVWCEHETSRYHSAIRPSMASEDGRRQRLDPKRDGAEDESEGSM